MEAGNDAQGMAAPESDVEVISKAKSDAMHGEQRRAFAAQKRDMEEKHAREIEKAMQSQSNGGTVNPDDIAAKVMAKLEAQFKEKEDAHNQRQVENEMSRVVDSFHSKIASGKEQYEDFDEAVSDINFSKFPQLVFLMANLDNNASGVMYELAKNPTKLAAINSLVQTDPEYAMKQLNKIAASVNENNQALNNNVETPQPLSRPKPSAVGSTSNRPMTIADYKKAPWNRR